MLKLEHDFPFDPSYGYSLEALLSVGVAEEPQDFDTFWKTRYKSALRLDPHAKLSKGRDVSAYWHECDLHYTSTDEMKIGGWCLIPREGKVERVLVVLHGYGGREEPDYHLKFPNTALFFPTARGISRSKSERISPDPLWHVLHDIQDPARYIHGGCVEDVWLGVSAALQLFPHCSGRVGLLGISFGGGIGAMALAYDSRIKRAHFNVPSFGNNALRLRLQTTGSGAAVQVFHRRKPEIVSITLSYHDAATAAKRIRVPVHFACALFDPMVAPPGQFAVHNAVSGEKELFVLRAGHHDYPEQEEEAEELLRELGGFFRKL
ncbi:MAG: acetylxylan esterase [Verrucomicrobiota bacterium]